MADKWAHPTPSVSPTRYGSARIFRHFLKHILRDKTFIVGGVILSAVAIIAISPSLFTNKAPTQIDLSSRLIGPSLQHPLGTDELGRDVWSRVAHGASASLLVAVGGVAVAALVGSAAGIAAAVKGRMLDNLAMRFMDILFAFPAILLALLIIGALGVGNISIVIAIAVVYVPSFARIGRGATLVVMQELYVEAARAIGVSQSRVILRHILPNIFAPLAVHFSVSLGFAVIIEASLSFLGMGLQPPYPSWGRMLSEGKLIMETSPWIVIGSGLALMTTVVGFNLVGDGLRDLLDPRLR